MEALTIILGIVAALLASLNIYQLVTFRSQKAKYKMEAEKDEAEAAESKQSALERRLSSIELQYIEQGKVIDDLRKEVLKLTKEKFENERRIIQLEEENKTQKSTVDRLVQEVEAYKTITKK